jgi:glycosyltransferase involved in cell wall biosynthesis
LPAVARPLVLVDADVLGRRRTGDESYVANLLRELGRLQGGPRIAAVTRAPDLVPPGIEAIRLDVRSQVARLAWRLGTAVRRCRPALAHFQYVIPGGCTVPAAVTVHDISFERFPHLLPLHDRIAMRMLVPRAMRRSRIVFTVSEWSKREILEQYGDLDAEKIVVTPNGVDPAFQSDGPTPDRRPYLLFVGALQPRKDPGTAVEALARLGDLDLDLVFVGPAKQRVPEVADRVSALHLEERVHHSGYVTQAELGALYRGAACLVFPSLHEGFGLPMVEAMASGTPVVAASSGALPEVAGGAAVLVPPSDPDALAEGVRTALSDRPRLVALGLARAAQFTWAQTARLTAAAYQSVLSS